jgi:hypothetical protein
MLMPQHPTNDLSRFVGCEPERLSIGERRLISGKWMAMELYTPRTTPARVIQAIGETPGACADQLGARGLDPRQFEFTLVTPAS